MHLSSLCTYFRCLSLQLFVLRWVGCMLHLYARKSCCGSALGCVQTYRHTTRACTNARWTKLVSSISPRDPSLAVTNNVGNASPTNVCVCFTRCVSGWLNLFLFLAMAHHKSLGVWLGIAVPLMGIFLRKQNGNGSKYEKGSSVVPCSF